MLAAVGSRLTERADGFSYLRQGKGWVEAKRRARTSRAGRLHVELAAMSGSTRTAVTLASPAAERKR